MKPEAQRIAIAEACGWTPAHHPAFDPLAPYGAPPNKPDGWERVPNYPVCLNAMHEAEKQLLCGGENSQYERYSNLLRDEYDLESVSATAAQRAKAFLKTIGKWKEHA